MAPILAAMAVLIIPCNVAAVDADEIDGVWEVADAEDKSPVLIVAELAVAVELADEGVGVAMLLLIPRGNVHVADFSPLLSLPQQYVT